MKTQWEHDLLRSVNEADDDLMHKVIEQCAWIMKKSGFKNWKLMLENAGTPRKEQDHKLSKDVILDTLEDENYNFYYTVMSIIDRRDDELAQLADEFMPMFERNVRDEVYDVMGLLGSKGFLERLLASAKSDQYWNDKFKRILKGLKDHKLSNLKGTKKLIAQIEKALEIV